MSLQTQTGLRGQAFSQGASNSQLCCPVSVVGQSRLRWPGPNRLHLAAYSAKEQTPKTWRLQPRWQPALACRLKDRQGASSQGARPQCRGVLRPSLRSATQHLRYFTPYFTVLRTLARGSAELRKIRTKRPRRQLPHASSAARPPPPRRALAAQPPLPPRLASPPPARGRSAPPLTRRRRHLARPAPQPARSSQPLHDVSTPPSPAAAGIPRGPPRPGPAPSTPRPMGAALLSLVAAFGSAPAPAAACPGAGAGFLAGAAPAPGHGL